jgi:FdhD protein
LEQIAWTRFLDNRGKIWEVPFYLHSSHWITMTQNSPINQRQFNNGTWLHTTGILPDETPVSLTINGQEWLTFSCTPMHLEALAIGFLYNEQVISTIREVETIRVCSGGENIDVWLTHSPEMPVFWQRTSGCTGGATRMVLQDMVTNHHPQFFTTTEIIQSMELLSRSQKMYRESGGLHCSALSDGRSLLLSAEDIGRHNTLDKIAGMMLVDEIAPERKMVLTTGRVSSEMLQKSSRLGASMVVSRTAPTSRSACMADQLGICLVGYVRGDHFTVYTHAEQIKPNGHPITDGNVTLTVQSPGQDALPG